MLEFNALEFLGWIGAACFSVCSLPQISLTLRTGRADGVSAAFLVLWLAGEVCMSVFMWQSGGLKMQLAANYVFNIVGICTILRYKIFPRLKD